MRNDAYTYIHREMMMMVMMMMAGIPSFILCMYSQSRFMTVHLLQISRYLPDELHLGLAINRPGKF